MIRRALLVLLALAGTAPLRAAADTPPPGLLPLPTAPALVRPLAAPDEIPFARIAATDLGPLKRLLEQAGWPEAAVYALVSAEAERRLNPPYEPRDEDLRPFAFWHTGPDALPLAEIETPAYMAELSRRELAFTAVLAELFPKKLGKASPFARWEERARWGDLAPEKRAAIERLRAETQAAIQEAANRPEGQDWPLMDRLRRDARARIEKLLTPEELLDHDLRNSPTAETLRNELDAFRPTRDEFLALFRLRHPLELDYPDQPDETDPALAARKQAAHAAVEAAIEKLLGPARYAEYALSRTPECVALQRVSRLTQKSDPAQVRDLARAVLAAREKIAALPADADRESAAIRARLHRDLSAVFGEKPVTEYLADLGLAP